MGATIHRDQRELPPNAGPRLRLVARQGGLARGYRGLFIERHDSDDNVCSGECSVEWRVPRMQYVGLVRINLWREALEIVLI